MASASTRPDRATSSHGARVWSRAAVLALTMMAALGGLRVVISGSSWWLVGALFIVLVLLTTTLVRQLSRRPWLPSVAGALVALLGLTIGYGGDAALLDVIPVPATLAHFSQLSDEAWRQIAVQSLPAKPELSLVFLIAVACAGLAVFADIALRIAPALTALPILTLLVVPVAVRAHLAQPVWYVAGAIGYLILLRIGHRRTTGSTLLAVSAVVIAGSFVLSSAFPSVDSSASQNASAGGVSTGINPLINLGDDLRQGAAITAVSYTTSDNLGVYLRLATLDDFDGSSWSPTLTTPTSTNKLSAFPAPVGLTSAIARTTATAKVTVGGIQGSWLPVAYPTSKVTGTTGSWFWEPQGLSVRGINANVGGETYTDSYLEVSPDLAQLRASTTDTQLSPRYLGLPAGLPQIITDTAEQVAGSASTDYDKALALQNYFQSDLFTYSTSAPVKQGYDGTGADVVATFLQKRSGYCVHFASAMAIMARVLGIPSRVAVGFQPGQPELKNGTTVFTVSTHDLHAWPELYFTGIGWLRFEPTPGRGELPDYSVPAAVAQLPTVAPSNVASSAPTASPTPTAAAGRDLPSDRAAASGSSGATTSANSGPLVSTIVLLILLAVALTPAAARLTVRYRRERAIARGRNPAEQAWAELRDTARDYGWLAPDTETAREFAGRLSMVLTDDASAIAGFRGHVESTAYAADAAPLELRELRAVRRAIARAADPRERVRAILLPASLLARVRL